MGGIMQDEAPNTPQVGILGYGYWGRKWARVFEEMGALAWVFDTNSDCLAAAQREHGLKKIAPSPQDRLGEIDGLVIATPSKTHYQLTRDAMLVGLDVLVEKPVATSIDKIDKLFCLANELDRVLLAGHTFMYSHPVWSFKECIESIGTIEHIRLSWRGPTREREDDVDVLWNIGPHPVSVLTDITGTPPTRTVAASGVRSSSSRDIVSAWLEFDSGLTADISISARDHEKQREIVAFGTEGTVKCEPTRGYVERIDADGVRERSFRTGPEPLSVEAFDFIECIRNREEPAAGINEATVVTETIEAIAVAAGKMEEPDLDSDTFLKS